MHPQEQEVWEPDPPPPHTHTSPAPIPEDATRQRRRAPAVSLEDQGVSPAGATTGADLGGSSNYSNENFEG